MMQETTASIAVSRRFSASAERVFDAWLDPAQACRFLFATPGGEMVRTDIDARIGGRFTIIERRSGEEVEHVGEYQEIDRPRRLVFTLSVPKFSHAAAVITIDIEPLHHGCELTLVEQAVPAEWVDRSREGWMAIIEGLATALEESADEG